MNEANNSSIDSEEHAVTETGEAPPPSGRATLTDPGQRFATIGRRSASNNQRKRYLAISEFGWDRPDVYDRPQPRMFGNSLLLAGSADTDGQGQGEDR